MPLFNLFSSNFAKLSVTKLNVPIVFFLSETVLVIITFGSFLLFSGISIARLTPVDKLPSFSTGKFLKFAVYVFLFES